MSLPYWYRNDVDISNTKPEKTISVTEPMPVADSISIDVPTPVDPVITETITSTEQSQQPITIMANTPNEESIHIDSKAIKPQKKTSHKKPSKK